jgi:hypothetical protein
VNSVRDEMRTEGMGDDFVFQPWPSDKLEYLSDALVKYETSGAEGLAYEVMARGTLPVRGVAALVGDLEAPDSVQLAVRLDAKDATLYPAIAAQLISSITDSLPSGSERGGETHTPIGTVSGFYAALGRADGFAAQAFLSPEKRGRGNFEPTAVSRFYGALSEPLALLDAKQTSVDQVAVRYRFRGPGGICAGAAIVTLRQIGMDFLINSIHAENGC